MARKKGNITKKIKEGIVDMMELFDDKTFIPTGLKKIEFISAFYKIPLPRVKRFTREEINTKWSQISTVKKWLIKKEKMAIIFKQVPRGTELSCPEFGKRILDRNTNIFFRCSDQEKAWDYKNYLGRISRGIDSVGESVVHITEQEKKKKAEQRAIEIINGNGHR
jgi:hypothetical protein